MPARHRKEPHKPTTVIMKNIWITLALTLVALPASAQTSSGNNKSSPVLQAPLLVFTNGSGRIVPYENGQLLEVGREYVITAVPDAGYAFEGWNAFTLFVIVEYLADGSVITNTVLSPVPINDQLKTRALRFTAGQPDVIFDDPGVRTITQIEGWQANFVPANTPGQSAARP